VIPLLIGQAPSGSSDSDEPLSGRSGRRLAELCDLEFDAYLRLFERRNLLQDLPGKAGKGDQSVTLREGRVLARACLGLCVGRRVVLLGFSTARMFDLVGPALAFSPHWRGEFAFCPHPSGVNSWWNVAENQARARRFWRKLARDAS